MPACLSSAISLIEVTSKTSTLARAFQQSDTLRYPLQRRNTRQQGEHATTPVQVCGKLPQGEPNDYST